MGTSTNPPRWLRLWQGLTTASPTAALATLATAAAWFVALSLVFSPTRLSTDFHRYFINHARDHDMVVTSRLLALRLSDEPKQRLIVAGSSTVRNSIDAKTLAKHLRRAGISIDETYDLTLARQRMPHFLPVLDHLPAKGGGILVIGINRTRLLQDPKEAYDENAERQRLGVQSDSWDALADTLDIEVPAAPGIFLWDNRRFYEPRLRKGLRFWRRGKKRRYNPRPYVRKKGRSYRSFKRIRQEFAEVRALDPAEAQRRQEINLGILRELATTARQDHGLFVVFYNSPINPKFADIGELEQWVPPLWAELEALAAELDVPIVTAPALPESAFYDQWHLRRRKALQQVTQDIAQQIAGVHEES